MTGTPCPSRQARDERILALLRRLVRVNTEHAAAEPGAPYGRGCARALSLVLEECELRGFATGRFGEKIAWAEVGSGSQLAAFPVHLDVVPAGDGWSADPYGAEVKDGVLYGRGCMDNKIGAAVLIELLDALSHEAELPCRFRIIFGTDEETGMEDLREYVEAGCELPSLGFVPDAAFPTIRGEKARLHVRATRPAPTCGFEVCGGTMANVVPAEAYGCFGDTRLRTVGRSAHGSTPDRGENAICALVREAVASGLADDEVLPQVDRLLCHDLTGEALGIDVPDETFGHPSVNLGVFSLADGQATLELDIRLGSAISTQEALSRIRTAFGAAWTVEVLAEKPLHLVAEDDPCQQALLAAYEQVTGEPGSTSVMAGGTYASLLPALVAFGPKLPSTHCGAHGADEHVSLANISRATDIYDQALRNIAALAATRED